MDTHEGFTDDDLDPVCQKCGKQLPGWTFSDIIAAEVRFRAHFPFDWKHVPRIILCDDCFEQAKKEKPPWL